MLTPNINRSHFCYSHCTENITVLILIIPLENKSTPKRK